METVKVDIQKLQLLNDRIAQTIEALNQVRLSVHGIQHTSSPVTPWTGQSYGSFGYNPYTQPYGQMPWGVQAYGQPYGVPFAQPFGQGISHTTSPITQQMWGAPTTPFTTPFINNGLSHTTLDPMWQVRAAQAFPFAGYPFVPVSIY